MNKLCVGLFGTCDNSTWRDAFVEDYLDMGIEFFNPVVADYNYEIHAPVEADHLATDKVILLPVLAESYGFGSLAEIGFAVHNATNNNQYVIVYIEPEVTDELKEAHPLIAKVSRNTRGLVKEHLSKIRSSNVYVVNSLDDMMDLSVKLYYSDFYVMP